MKKPEKAPDWRKILQNKNKEVMDLFTSPKAKKIITRANKEYLYWDRFKYINLPTETNHEIAWAYLKLMRGTQGKKTPVKDIEHLSFHYWLPEIILRELHYIDQHAGGQILMDDSSMHSGEKERYLINSIMEEAIASSQLEGAATTRKKAKDLLRSGRKPKSRAEQMIVNNYITIRNIKKIIDKPLTPELLKDLQASMTKDTLDDNDASGRFRKENEVIHVVDNTEGIVLFEPPPAKEIDTRIKRLCVYANDQQKQEFTHPIIKAVILHFWLAYIHPFVDGNGRTARALFYWYVLKNKYWLFEFLSVSRIIIKAPSQYARSYLYAEMDDGDLTYFINFHLRAIHLAVKELKDYLSRQQKIISESRKFLRKYPGLNFRQQSLLYHALAHPDATYSIEFHKNVYDVAYETARSDLLDLVEKGFLDKIQQGKTFYFIPKKDIAIKLKKL